MMLDCPGTFAASVVDASVLGDETIACRLVWVITNLRNPATEVSLFSFDWCYFARIAKVVW